MSAPRPEEIKPVERVLSKALVGKFGQRVPGRYSSITTKVVTGPIGAGCLAPRPLRLARRTTRRFCFLGYEDLIRKQVVRC